MAADLQSLSELVGKAIVLDVVSPYVYIGVLTGWDDRYLHLEDADVHDLRDSTTTRELYVLDTRRHGVTANRGRVFVNREQVVSLSLLDDVVC